ncbi:MAG: cell division ATP-binding protein FtsE [Hyphomonadaceae bacterium]
MPRHSPDRIDAPSVRFDRVGLRYDSSEDVLSDLTFELEQGSFTFLTGASGAGKTSLLRLIYLALQPSAGEIYLFGQRTSQLKRAQLAALRRRVGIVFQDFRLLEHLSAYENVALPLRVQGKKEVSYRADVEDLLQWVGLGARLHARPTTLSGGEQQRVAIARALVAKPDLLIADEPTGNVDPEMGERLMRLFAELNKRLGASVLIATHDLGLIERTSAPVMRLQNGLLVRDKMGDTRG